MTKKTYSILLLDRSITARRAAIVRETIAELVEKAKPQERSMWKTIHVEHLVPSEQSTIVEIVKSGFSGLVLIVITEEQLSTLTEGKHIPRNPCRSILLGYDLIPHLGIDTDLYFVVQDGNITGVDVVALLLSGARGVIGSEALGSPVALEALVRATRDFDKQLNRTLIGHPQQRLNLLREKVIATWQLPLPHWNLLLALAEIPRLRLPIDGNVPKQGKIAEEVARWSHMTGYELRSDTYRRLPLLLSIVTSDPDEGGSGEEEWLETDRESFEEERSGQGRFLAREGMFDLPYLPLYARMTGLPSQLLPIRGLRDDAQLTDYLYKGLRGIEFKSTKVTPDGLTIAQVTMPRNLFKNLAERRAKDDSRT